MTGPRFAICAFAAKPLRQNFSISINVSAHFAPNRSSGDFWLLLAILGKPSFPCLGPLCELQRRISSVYSDHSISPILLASFCTAAFKAAPTARPSAVDAEGRSSNSSWSSFSSWDSPGLRVLPICFCLNWSNRSSFGAAPVHRDPPQPVYRLRKNQCISQKTWNYLRRWLRGAPGPLAARGGGGRPGGRGAAKKI